MIRVAHATDIHWYVPPEPCQLTPKRALGLANLHLKGRRRHFDPEVQRALVHALGEQQPDLVVISGDLTALATPKEFLRARQALTPLLDRIPTFVQPGNHDVYTREAQRADRIGAFFAPWLHRAGPIARLDRPGLTVLGLDPNRPHLTASGRVPPDQLRALADALTRVPVDHRLLLTLHYPLVDRHGALYDHWEHGLQNVGELIAVLKAAPRVPDGILHGHVHHGYQGVVDLGHQTVPTFNPGSGGYAWMPKSDRAACFNVYHLEPEGPVQVKRFRHDGATFVEEPGGAYASGR